MATGASFHTLSSPTALCAFIVGALYSLFSSLNLPFPNPASSFQSICYSSFLFFFVLFIPRFSLLPNILITLMASSSSRKKRERIPSPSEGKSSSGFAQGESHEITKCPAFPLWDPWYNPSLFFPWMSHGEAPPSPHAWVFSSQAGFTGSTQVPDPREILDLPIRRGFQEAVTIFFDFVPRKIQGWPI